MQTFFESWKFIAFFWAVVVGAWIVGLLRDLLFAYWWLDIIIHFLGGAWAVAFFWKLSCQSGITMAGPYKRLSDFIVLIGMVTWVGVLWEFGEFIADRYIFHTGFTLLKGAFEDTLSDLFFDMSGAVTGALFYLSIRK